MLDVERLAKLSAWCRVYGYALNVHWLLTGDAAKVAESVRAPGSSARLTSACHAAIRRLADDLADLPRASDSRKKGASWVA